MVSKSLREWLRVLEQDGVLKHVGREVNLEHELAAVGKKACGTYAVWFDKPIGERLPKDNKIPVVTGICGNRAMFAKAMGVSAREMSGTFSEAQAHPIEPVVVPPGEAPVKAVVTRQVNLYGPVSYTHLVAWETQAAVRGGADILMVDTGAREDLECCLSELAAMGCREHIKVAFAGNVKLTDIPELSERADILCIGKEIVDAPLLDWKLDVMGEEC